MVISVCKKVGDSLAAQISRMLHNYAEVLFTRLQKSVANLSELCMSSARSSIILIKMTVQRETLTPSSSRDPKKSSHIARF